MAILLNPVKSELDPVGRRVQTGSATVASDTPSYYPPICNPLISLPFPLVFFSPTASTAGFFIDSRHRIPVSLSVPRWGRAPCVEDRPKRPIVNIDDALSRWCTIANRCVLVLSSAFNALSDGTAAQYSPLTLS